MARIKMVTRTIDKTVAKVMCLNVVSCETTIETYELNGIFTDKDFLEIAKEKFDTNEKKLVHVTESKVEEVLYGMTEEKFMELAEILPPRKKQGGEEIEI